ncbi:MAG: DNA polymerase III subunit delta, partial [Dysgonamonadaceae bacterium]|nr:DNA polymerase III subunit delta [Dysgonamonadaceae bacterium]
TLLDLKFSFQLADYTKALRIYNSFKTLEIIALLREYDAKSKGFGNSSVSEGDLMKELAYKIMH